MTTPTQTAQAAAQILTYLGFAQAVSMEPGADRRRDHIQALIESALLSKLRAPVADESPMAKMADALREKARQEQQAYQDRRNQATEWGPMPEGTEADRPIPIASVAHVAGDETSRYLEWAKDRSAWEMPVGTPVYYSALASAPVAGEARMPPGYRVKVVEGHGYRVTAPSGSGWVAHNDTPVGDLIAALLAAPQASEAVRDAALKRACSLREVTCKKCGLQVISSCRGDGCPVKDRYADLRALSAQPGAQQHKQE